jgi:hypothetical protein
VDVKAVIMVRGTDQKLYPARQLSGAELNRMRRLAHNLVCRDRMSIRAAQRTLRESYGVRRSVGAIHKDLARFYCGPQCLSVPAEQPAGQPAAAQRPPAAVHQHPGGLTGMVSGG